MKAFYFSITLKRKKQNGQGTYSGSNHAIKLSCPHNIWQMKIIYPNPQIPRVRDKYILVHPILQVVQGEIICQGYSLYPLITDLPMANPSVHFHTKWFSCILVKISAADEINISEEWKSESSRFEVGFKWGGVGQQH